MPLPTVLSGRRRWRFAYLVANGVGQAGVAVATAMLVQNGFDTLVSSGAPLSARTAAIFVGGLTTALVVGAWLRWRAHIDAEHLGQGYVHAVRMTLFRHIARIGADGARQMSRGAMVLRFIGDLTALRQWISLGLSRLTVSGIATILAIGVLSLVEPVVAIAVTIAVAVSTVLALGIGPNLRIATRETRRRRGRLAAMLNDRVARIGVIEAFGQEGREQKRFERLSTRLRHSLVSLARVVGLLRALSEASASFASMCALFVGAFQVSMGHASPGAVVAAMVVAGFLAPRLQDLGRVYEYWNGALIAREKLEQMLALKAVRRKRRDGKNALVDGPGRIALEGVTVAGVMDEVEAVINARERIAVIGPNGAGKSTLLRVIAGIVQPDAGAVLLDDQNLADCRWRDVRRAFAIVSPDLPLLRGTLRFNLAYGAEGLREEDMAETLSALGLNELIGRLPKGIETRISEDGGGLSTGERARIALARALLTRPRVLLLDEADANLDRTARQALDRAIDTFDGTVVVVTHDPAQAASAGRVLRLQGGKLTPAHAPGAADKDNATGNGPSAGAQLVR